MSNLRFELWWVELQPSSTIWRRQLIFILVHVVHMNLVLLLILSLLSIVYYVAEAKEAHYSKTTQLVYYPDHVRQCSNRAYHINMTVKFNREAHAFLLNHDTYFSLFIFNMDGINVDRTFGRLWVTHVMK
jgi:hypothetical protein